MSAPGCPIRKPADRFALADTRGLSQLVASFVAFQSLGIPRVPLIRFSVPKARENGRGKGPGARPRGGRRGGAARPAGRDGHFGVRERRAAPPPGQFCLLVYLLLLLDQKINSSSCQRTRRAGERDRPEGRPGGSRTPRGAPGGRRARGRGGPQAEKKSGGRARARPRRGE